MTTAGEQVMLLLYADNWDSLPQVINYAQVIEFIPGLDVPYH